MFPAQLSVTSFTEWPPFLLLIADKLPSFPSAVLGPWLCVAAARAGTTPGSKVLKNRQQNLPECKNLKSVLFQSKDLRWHRAHGRVHPYWKYTGSVTAATAGYRSASCLGGQRWPAASGGPFCFYVRWSFHAAPPLKRERKEKNKIFIEFSTLQLWAAPEGDDKVFFGHGQKG